MPQHGVNDNILPVKENEINIYEPFQSHAGLKYSKHRYVQQAAMNFTSKWARSSGI